MALYLIGKSSDFAAKKHAGQMYGSAPYHVHLADAVNVVRRFIEWDKIPQEIIDAVWTHDTLEDTKTTREELEALFGLRVAELVHAVTNEPGENRKERHAKTYPKIRAVDGAILVKLADRVANIEQSISHDRFGRPPQKIFNMYLKEWDSFQNELRGKCMGEGDAEKMMWAYLDELFIEGKEKLDKLRELKTFRGII